MDTDKFKLSTDEVKLLADLLNVCSKTQGRKTQVGFKLDDTDGRYIKFKDYFDYSLNLFNNQKVPFYVLKDYTVCAVYDDKITNTYATISRNNNDVIISFDCSHINSYDDMLSLFCLSQTEYHGYRCDDAFLNDYLTVKDDIIKFFNDSIKLGLSFDHLYITGFSIGGVFSTLLLIDLIYYGLIDKFKKGVYVSIYTSIRFLHPKSVDLLNENIEKFNVVFSHLNLSSDNVIYYPPRDYTGLTIKKKRKFGRSIFYPSYCKCKYETLCDIVRINPSFNDTPTYVLELKDESNDVKINVEMMKSIAMHNLGLLYTMLIKLL